MMKTYTWEEHLERKFGPIGSPTRIAHDKRMEVLERRHQAALKAAQTRKRNREEALRLTKEKQKPTNTIANVDVRSIEKVREITDKEGNVVDEQYGEQQFAPTSNPLEFFQLDRDLGHTEVVVSLNGLMGYFALDEAIESSAEPEVIPETPTEIQVTSEQEPIIIESPAQIEANPIASLLPEVSHIIGINTYLMEHLQYLSDAYDSGELSLQELLDAIQDSSATFDDDWTILYKENRDLYNKIMEDCY